MRPPYRPARKVRPAAIVMVLLAHALLVLLFMLLPHSSRDEPGRQLVFLSLWPDPRTETKVSPQPPPQQQNPARRRAASPPTVDAPSTAITSPAENGTPEESPRPWIDWHAEAAAVAGRHATPIPPAQFAPPPKALRKPCEKKKSSWEWNKQPKKAGLAPLPYVVLGRCVVGLGFFACSPQKPPEANSHLLDDMRNGKTSPSSVPDPDICE